MPKDTLQKQKQKQQYGEILGKKEVDDFQKHLFDVDKFGGTKEAEERIERYSKKVTLSEEDKKILRENVPEAPSFTAMRKEQYDKQG